MPGLDRRGSLMEERSVEYGGNRATRIQLSNTLDKAMPETITYSRLRNELAKTLDKVNRDRAPLLIVRQRGKSAVLLAAEEYSALEETAHLLRSPRNAARLRAAHEEIEKEIARRAAARRPRRSRRR
jgi:antitoxin YefM